MGGKGYWNTIPKDVLGLILNKFDDFNDFKTLNLLCKRTHDNIFRYFNFANITLKQSKQLLRNNQNKVIYNKSYPIKFHIKRLEGKYPSNKSSTHLRRWNIILNRCDDSMNRILYNCCIHMKKRFRYSKCNKNMQLNIMRNICLKIRAPFIIDPSCDDSFKPVSESYYETLFSNLFYNGYNNGYTQFKNTSCFMIFPPIIPDE